MKIIKVNDWSEIPKNFTGIVEFSDGEKRWYKNGKLHRTDGPACEWANGTKKWWIEGKEYKQLNLKDFVVLDHYQGKCNLMWYKLLDEDEIFEHPDIPGLIIK